MVQTNPGWRLWEKVDLGWKEQKSFQIENAYELDHEGTVEFFKMDFLEREEEKHQLVIPVIYAFIGGFLHKCTTLAYWNDALTH